jgi:hypothetical protein
MSENHTLLTQDVLVAFVDGELPADQGAAVEAALNHDAAARETVRRLQVSARLAANLSRDGLDEALPLALVEKIQAWMRADPKVQARAKNRRIMSALPLALAASIVALIVGANVGYMAHDLFGGYSRAEAPGSDAMMSVYEATLQGALSSDAAPGQSFGYASSGVGEGRVTLGASFTTTFGAPCREFTRDETRGGAQRSAKGIACRAANGSWNVLVMPGVS